MYCSILWNALHYNYVAGVALQQAACWFSSAKVVEIVRQFNQKMLQLRQKFCQIVRFILFRSEKCTFCNTACSMFCFWNNIKETPDNFNDFSTTKPARCQQVISYSVCSLTFCITLQSEFLSCLQEQSVHLFIYICTFCFCNYIVAQYKIYIKWKQTSEISWLIIHYLKWLLQVT